MKILLKAFTFLLVMAILSFGMITALACNPPGTASASVNSAHTTATGYTYGVKCGNDNDYHNYLKATAGAKYYPYGDPSSIVTNYHNGHTSGTNRYSVKDTYSVGDSYIIITGYNRYVAKCTYCDNQEVDGTAHS